MPIDEPVDINSKLYTDSMRDAIIARENAENRANNILSGAERAQYQQNAMNIVRAIYNKWIRATTDTPVRLGDAADNRGNAPLPASLRLGDRDIRTGDYRGVLYYMAKFMLNRAINEKMPPCEPVDELVSRDDFKTLLIYDMALVTDGLMRKAIARPDLQQQYLETQTLGMEDLNAPGRLDYYYTRFINMLCGKYHNQADPKLQYTPDDKMGTLSIGSTVQHNGTRRNKVFNTYASVDTNGTVGGQFAGNAFVVSAMLDDVVDKLRKTVICDGKSDSEMRNMAADILRFGTRSATILKRYPGLGDGGAYGTRVGHILGDYKWLSRHTLSPAFFTYVPADDSVRCPQALVELFMKTMGLSDEQVSVTYKQNGMYNGATITMNERGPNKPMAAKLNTALTSDSPKLTAIRLAGGEGGSLDSMALDGSMEGEDTGAANRIDAATNSGLEELRNGGTSTSDRSNKFNRMLKSIAGNDMHAIRSINRILPGINCGKDVILGMTSMEISEFVVKVLQRIVELINDANGTAYSINVGTRDGHSAVTVTDGTGKKLSEVEATEALRNGIATSNIGELGPLSGPIKHIMAFMYDTTGPDSKVGAGEIDYRPSFMLYGMLTNYIENGGNAAYGELCRSVMRVFGERTLRSYFSSMRSLKNFIDKFDDHYASTTDKFSQLVDDFYGIEGNQKDVIGQLLSTLDDGDSADYVAEWLEFVRYAAASFGTTEAFDEDAIELDESDSTDARNIASDLMEYYTPDELGDRYCNGNVGRVINAFDGSLHDYLAEFYAGKRDPGKLSSLAREITESGAYSYVRDGVSTSFVKFDPSVASDVFRNDRGQVIHRTGEIQKAKMLSSPGKKTYVRRIASRPRR